MQSVRAGAVQTYFFIFTLFPKSRSNKTQFGVHFGDDSRPKCNTWVKKGAPKNTLKKLSRQTQTAVYSNVPGLPGSHPKVKDCLSKKQQSEQETAIWARNKNSCSFRVHFWAIVLKWVMCSNYFVQSLFDFRFKLTIHLRPAAPMRAHVRDLTRPGLRPGEFWENDIPGFFWHVFNDFWHK